MSNRRPPPRPGQSGTPSTSTTTGGSPGGGSGTTPAPAKTKKPRKSDEQREAELEAQLQAVRERKALKAIGENKPLAAAVKAARLLRKWLPEELGAAVSGHMQRLVAANSAAAEGEKPESAGEE